MFCTRRIIVLLIRIIKNQGVIMAAIDNLNSNVADLKATVEGLTLPVNQDTAIQAAADVIAGITAELKAKTA